MGRSSNESLIMKMRHATWILLVLFSAATRNLALEPYAEQSSRSEDGSIRVEVIHNSKKPPRIRRNYQLPANATLHSRYYSEKVEESLGHVKLAHSRVRKQVPQLQLQRLDTNAATGLSNSGTVSVLDQQRFEDLEEIFRILAQRDGLFLEQMKSVREAIDNYFRIFQFLGVASLPVSERDAAIRKILLRGLQLEHEGLKKSGPN